MPRAAINKGYATKIIPLEGLASFLVAQCGTDRASQEKSQKPEKNEKNEKSDNTPVSSQRG
jgi:hypothetical protein